MISIQSSIIVGLFIGMSICASIHRFHSVCRECWLLQIRMKIWVAFSVYLNSIRSLTLGCNNIMTYNNSHVPPTFLVIASQKFHCGPVTWLFGVTSCLTVMGLIARYGHDWHSISRCLLRINTIFSRYKHASIVGRRILLHPILFFLAICAESKSDGSNLHILPLLGVNSWV